MEFVWVVEPRTNRFELQPDSRIVSVRRLLIRQFLRVHLQFHRSNSVTRGKLEEQRKTDEREKKIGNRVCGSFNAQTRESYQWKTSSSRSTTRHVMTIDAGSSLL